MLEAKRFALVTVPSQHCCSLATSTAWLATRTLLHGQAGAKSAVCQPLQHGCHQSSVHEARGNHVVAHARNIYKEVERDLLPNGKPNTPVRRLSYDITKALTLAELADLARANRHKAVNKVWRDKHEASLLMRAAALVYHKAVAGDGDATLADELSSLLRLASERACRSEVMRLVEGRRLAQLLVAAARLPGCTMPATLTEAMLRELLREGGKKLRGCDPELFSDTVWALAVLRAGFERPLPGFPGQSPHRPHQQKHQWDVPGDASTGSASSSSSAPSSPRGLEGRAKGAAASNGQPGAATLLPLAMQVSLPSTSASSRATTPAGPGASSYRSVGLGKDRLWSEVERQALLVLQHQRQRQLQQGPGLGLGSGPDEGAAYNGAGPMDAGFGEESDAQGEVIGAWPIEALPSLGLQGLARMAWGLATAGCSDEQVFALVEAVALDFPSLQASESQAALASRKPAATPTAVAGSSHAAGVPFTSQDAQAVSNLAYAFAKAGVPCPRLMPRLCSIFAALVSQPAVGTEPAQAGTGSGPAPQAAQTVAGPSHVAKLLWATAALQHKDTDLLLMLASHIPAARYRFTGEELASVAWAYAEHGLYKPPLFAYLAKTFVSGRMYGISDGQLTQLARAFASVGHADRPFFSTVARLAIGRQDKLSPSDLSSLAWALAVVRQPHDALFEAAAHAATSHVRSFTPKELSELVWAFRAARFPQYSRMVLSAATEVQQRLAPRLPVLPSQQQQQQQGGEQANPADDQFDGGSSSPMPLLGTPQQQPFPGQVSFVQSMPYQRQNSDYYQRM